ncbi:hypothetical protein A2Z23_02680 [Candidatus Curtissbacteria bacterium RBG_16_39_7]|uniref:Uncharacterized protein n=1 Tax=Candidatus Curtissbacteria bacterium RBG_16_39_7 TaxID=1797707 RepID=A0A1F5G1U2_9BACT|nr:MAG: hypothetical protein A2Z23_02680 [Candidatus Curtissbacteria bacterium RBG_16_39_7]
MTSLTRAAYLTKQMLIFAVIIGGILVGLWIFWGLGKQIWRSINPPSTPPPTVSFGQLPSLNFSGAPFATSSSKIRYEIETIEGKMPKLPTQAKVFKVNQSPASILSGEKAKQKAAKLGFYSTPQQLSDRIYVFKDDQVYGHALTIDIVTGSFSITSDLYQFPELLSLTGQIRSQTAIELAKNFLKDNVSTSSDFPDAKIQTKNLKLEDRELVEAKSIGDTQLIRVDFYRQDLDKLPILPLEKDKANIWALVSPLKDSKKKILEASFTYWPVDTQTWATYPLKTSDEAFNELQLGQGMVVSAKGSTAIIRKVYLAYLETKTLPGFFQPVFVFDGDDSFRAFVPAIQTAWIKG